MNGGSPPGPVAAVICDQGDAALAAITSAVVSQSPAPDQVILATSQRRARALEARFGSAAAVVADRSPVGAAVNLALGKSAQWIWVLDGRRVPQPGALAAFLEAAAAWPDRRLRLLSSQLVDADGTLLTAEAPLPQPLDPDLAVEAFARRTCSLRVAGYGSLLVGADALREAMPPSNGAGADLVWSARLLAGGVGLLVPGSVAVGARPGGARAVAAARGLVAVAGQRCPGGPREAVGRLRLLRARRGAHRRVGAGPPIRRRPSRSPRQMKRSARGLAWDRLR